MSEFRWPILIESIPATITQEAAGLVQCIFKMLSPKLARAVFICMTRQPGQHVTDLIFFFCKFTHVPPATSYHP